MKYSKFGKKVLKLPLFFPDATRALIKTIDSIDIKNTKTPGILVNTFHLFNQLNQNILSNFEKGIREFMNWQGAIISDSGGFQVMSLVKRKYLNGEISDQGIVYKNNNKTTVFTPEKSISFQMLLKTDLLVVLDDFTPPDSTKKIAKETVERTLGWARRSKIEFEKICEKQKISDKRRPYLIAVVQGGDYLDLRKKCTQKLVEIGFDGLGYGGWPIKKNGEFNYQVAECISENSPKKYLLYGLGIGKPEDIIGCVNLGYDIFDCVLPTRDARHGRLYVYNEDSIDKIDLKKMNFYSFYDPIKNIFSDDKSKISKACDCLLCKNYSKAYLYHLFKTGDLSAKRLATIHNLRFYSILMEKLQQT